MLTNMRLSVVLFSMVLVERICADGVFKVVSLSFGKESDLSTAPVVSSVSAALQILKEKYPQVLANYTHHSEKLTGEAVCTNDDRGAQNIEIGLGNVYSTGVLEPQGPTMIIAASCPEVFQSIATYAREMDILALSYTTSDERYKDKVRFPTLLALGIGAINEYGDKVMALMDQYHWKSMALIVDKVSAYSRIGYSRRVASECQGVQTRLRLRPDIQFLEISVDSRPLGSGSNETAEWASKALLQAANFSRIILACTLGPPQREIAMAAAELGMTNGDYVFLHLYEIEVPNEEPLHCRNPDGSFDEKLCDALGSYFMVRSEPVNWPPLRPFITKAEKYAKAHFAADTLKNLEIAGAEMMVSIFEALETVVQTLDRERRHRVLTNDSTAELFFSGRRTLAQTFNQTYNLTSRQVSVSNVGTRVIPVHMQVFSQSAMSFQTAFLSNSTTAEFQRIGTDELPWEPGPVPLDRPACGIHNERCYRNEQTSKHIAIILGVFVPLIVLVATGVVFEKWHRQAHAYKQWMIGPESVVRSAYMSTTASALSFQLGGKRMLQVRGVKAVCCSSEAEDSCDLIGGMCADPTNFMKGHSRMKVSLKKTQLSKVLSQISTAQHANVNRFLGVFLHSFPPFLCQQFCERGSLDDLMHRGAMDWDLKLSLVHDFIEGLHAVHHSAMKFHGNLRPTKCVIDQRFCLKIDDLGHEAILGFLGTHKPPNQYTPYTAPEILLYHPASQQSDMFAFGAIVTHLVTEQPMSRTLKTIFFDGKETKESAVTHIRNRPSFHAHYEHHGCQPLEQLIEKCWEEDPGMRPSAASVRAKLRKVVGRHNLLESLLDRLRNHTETLEVLVYTRKLELLNEQQRCDALLNEMLPREVVRKLRAGEEVLPEAFDSVTIFFSYLQGFTDFAAHSSPLEIVNFLDILYSRFDDSLGQFSVCKIEATGDNYLVASGLPVRNGSEHVQEICALAFELLAVFGNNLGGRQMHLQAGVHSGPVEAGIIGNKRPRYCLFGDTVNTASRMASHGAPNRIHVSAESAGLAEKFAFHLEDRGLVFIKGKGETRTFWLNPFDSTLVALSTK